jgi:hypothetical protein
MGFILYLLFSFRYIFTLTPSEIIGIATLIGGSGVGIKIIIDYLTEPKLEFGTIVFNQNPKDPNEKTFFLRVKKSKGNGKAQECGGRITIEGKYTFKSVWAFDIDSVLTQNIGTHKDLRLFTLIGDVIFFPLANTGATRKETKKKICTNLRKIC